MFEHILKKGSKPKIKHAPQLHDYGAERKRRNRMFIIGGSALAVYIVLVGSAWLILRSGIFYARSVDIGGMKAVPEGDVDALLRSDVLGTSFVKNMLGFRHLFVWPHELAGEALASIPEIKHIDIEKSYVTRSLVVTVTEREPYGIWCAEARSASRCMWFDEEGVVFKRGFVTEGNLIKIVHDDSREALALGERVLPGRMMPVLLGIFHVLEASGVSVKNISISNIELEEITVDTYAAQNTEREGPHLYFSLRFMPAQALAVLNAAREDKTFGKLSYIDFRTEHRAYSK